MSVLDRYSLKKPFRNSVTPLLEAILNITSGHDHDGVNSKLVASDYSGPDIRTGKITLNGGGATPVVFGTATAASKTTGDGTFDLTAVGDGGTIIINPDGDGNQTATINAAAATSVSAASPSTDISAESDDSFSIAVDGGEAEDVQLTLTGLDTGAKIATAMQNAIRALGGAAADVTVAYTSVYTVTSGTLGTGSSIVIAAPSTGGSLCEELKLGTPGSGVETAGTGDCVNLAAVTAAEVVAVCDDDMTGVTATVSGDAVKFTSDTTGKDSSLVIGNGTLDAALTLTNAAAFYGAQSIGYSTDMADDEYFVTATLNGVARASLGATGLSITTRTTAGFSVECETAASTAAVDVIIVGTAA
jgi:hypothetical protein